MTDAAGAALRRLAAAAGIEHEYWDVRGQRHEASLDTLVGALRAWGVPIEDGAGVDEAWTWFHERAAATVLEPVHTVWAPAVGVDPDHDLDLDLGDAGSSPSSLWVRLRLPRPPPGRARATLVTEAGISIDLGAIDLGRPETVAHGPITTQDWWIELSTRWPVGYHRLEIEIGSSRYDSTVIVAPPTVRGFAPDERTWGVFAPVYALRSRADVGALGRLAAWIEPVGGQVVATLPLLATYLDQPFAPSPYTPVSRRFWNEAHLDVTALGLPSSSPPVVEAVAALAALDQPGPFDHRRQAAVVARLLAAVDWPEATADEMPDLIRYAQFRAAVERTGTGWHGWPGRQRGGDLGPGDFDPDVALRHVVGQLAMRRQLGDLAATLERRGQRLYLDLPVGAHPDGFDTWFEPELFARGASTGAPPDDFFAAGQDWGFPPISPRASRDQAHAHIRACLRHHMEVAGIVRLDHVMGLHRLYWVPAGAAATEGTYVHYPQEELFAVLALESMRHDCIVVGEDLGTVPDEIRQAMDRHQAAGMYVAEFELPSWAGAELAAPPHRSVATLDTHDTPTFAGFARGLDIAQRVETDQLAVDDTHGEFDARGQQVANLRGFLQARGLISPPYDDFQLLVGALRFLGSSDAACVLVTLEDLWGEVNPQNIPGTPAERPNWVQRFPFSIERMADDRRVVAALGALDESRRPETGKRTG